MDHLNWDDLRVFLAYCRQGGMRACAAHLGVSHSTVARRLEHMQEKAGVRFLERSETGVVLSPAGQDFLEAAERVETEIIGLQRRSFGRDRELEGPLVLTMIEALCVPTVMQILEEFRRQHPGIMLTLDINQSVANLDRREADLALRFAERPAEHLVGQRIYETGQAVYVSRSYYEAHWPNPKGRGAGWINYVLTERNDTWMTQTPFPSLPTRLRVEDLHAQLNACRAGFGLAYLPCFLCAGYTDLLRLTEPDFPKSLTLWLLRHPDTKKNRRVRALSAHLAKNLKKQAASIRVGAA